TNPANDDPTCVPLNPFGAGSVSAAARDYVNGDAYGDYYINLDVVAANLRGSPFHTWAGPVSFAAGAEYRSDRINIIPDPLSAAGRFLPTNFPRYSGNYNVKEGYAEVLAPLLSNSAIGSLDLNAAAR